MATIGRLVYDIEARTAGIEQSVRTVVKSLDTVEKSAKSAEGTLGLMGKAIAGAFTVDRLIAFTKELMEFGHQTEAVANRTGLTVEEVQRLDMVARVSGNSIEDLTNAIGQLQNRLATGDKSAVNAVKILGLNFKELRAASPYEQVTMIAEAFGKIPDPVARAALATDLFGKSGRQILPTLTADVIKLGKEMPVMSEKTVAALAQADDTFEMFGRTIKVWAAESYNWLGKAFDLMMGQIYKWVGDAYAVTARLIELARNIPGAGKILGSLGVDEKSLRETARWYYDTAKTIVDKTQQVEVAVRKAAPAILDLTDHTKEQAAAAKKAAKAQEDWEKATRNAFPWTQRTIGNFVDLSKVTEENENLWKGLTAEGLIPAEHAFRQLVTTAPEVSEQFDIVATKALTLRQQLAKIAESIPQTVANSLTGGGGVMGAVKSVASGVGAAVGGSIGMAVGGPLGASIGAAIGSMGGALVGAIGKLFGPSKEYMTWKQAELDANKAFASLKQNLLDTYGGLDRIREISKLVGINLEAAFGLGGSGGPGQVGLKELTRLADEFAARYKAFQSMEEVAGKYGIAIDQLGEKWTAWKINEKAAQLLSDFNVLAGNGANLDAVFTGMAGSINEVVQKALSAGATIPEGMRPLIEKMIDWNQLTDAAGNKITDISKIQFAAPLTDSFNRVADSIDRLVDRLDRVPGAIGKIAESKIPEINIPLKWSLPEDVGYSRDGEPIQTFAGGSGGYRDFGSGTLAMLHGREAVVPEGKGGPSSRETETRLASIESLLANQPTVIARAVRDAVLLIQ